MATAQPRTEADTASQALPAPEPPRPAAPPAETELTLKFSSDSWAEVVDAGGQRLFYDVGGADSVHTVHGKAPLKVMLGNAPGVGVEINGHRTGIESMVRSDGSARFIVYKDGRAVVRRGGG